MGIGVAVSICMAWVHTTIQEYSNCIGLILLFDGDIGQVYYV